VSPLGLDVKVADVFFVSSAGDREMVIAENTRRFR
jgi:hypothetical protein